MNNKHVILLSIVIPTFNNIRAASALPYHLLSGMRDASFEIFSFNINDVSQENINNVEKELNVKIHVLSQPWWTKLIFKWHLGFIRLFLKHPYLTYFNLSKKNIRHINAKKPDLVWIYGEEITGLAKHFLDTKIVATMPDCTSLYYYRLLGKAFANKCYFDVIRYATIYYKYLRFERFSFQISNNLINHVKYHFVGQPDVNFFKEINPKADAVFLRHPLYAYQQRAEIKFHTPIRILVAGRYDLYMKAACDEAFAAIVENAAKALLVGNYEFTFLGTGWEKWNEQFAGVGLSSKHIRFVPDYVEELIQHDIQLTPISVGTGTKGKVLDAIANGLLEIGTEGALENIAVVDGSSCILYRNAVELITVLKDIPDNIQRYEVMAKKGYEEIHTHHASEKIAHLLFS